MLTDKSRGSDELRVVLREKGRLEKQIRMFQRRIGDAEGQLTTRASTTRGYQKALENLRALQAYVAELYGQVASLDEAIRDLALAQEDRPHP
jgi:prefoldin subunit 5